MDSFAHYGDVEGVACAALLHCEDYGSARLALHSVCALLDFKVLGEYTVDGNDLVAAYESGLGGRGVRIWLVDDHIAALRLVDDGSDASVCVGKHHLEILVLLLRDIDCVRVEFLQHSVHSGSEDSVYRERIHV